METLYHAVNTDININFKKYLNILMVAFALGLLFSIIAFINQEHVTNPVKWKEHASGVLLEDMHNHHFTAVK
ncbi:MAG TPA: hypothetical protein ACFCUD_12060 [Cyclobacteriaceae bacterium]